MSAANGILFGIALRNLRIGFLIVTLLPAAVAAANSSAFAVIAGESEQERIAFARSMEVIATQMTYLLPLPERTDDLGGFLHWRVMGFVVLLFSVWGAIAASGMTRSQEDRGNWEQWLSVGVSRLRLMVVTASAFYVAAAVSIAFVMLAMWAGAMAASETLSLPATLAEGAALYATVVAAFSIGLVVAQFMPSGRTTLSTGSAIVVMLFFLNSMSRTVGALDPANHVSPFYWFDITNSMVPGGTFDTLGFAVLVASAVALTAMATAIFLRRDIGSPWLSRRRDGATSYVPSHNILLKIPVASDLYEQRFAISLWATVIAVLSAFIGSMAKSATDFIDDIPAFAFYRELLGVENVYEALLGVSGFGLLQLILAAFAVTTVARWASDDTDGRLEMTLSAPTNRWRVVVERAAALAFASAFLIFVGVAAMVVSVAAQGIDVNVGLLARSALGLLPFSLSFGALGAAVVTRYPRPAVATLSVVAILSFFDLQLGPMLSWPEWVINLSVFSLFGNPVVEGTYWPGMWALTTVTVVGFAAALRNIYTRDVGR